MTVLFKTPSCLPSCHNTLWLSGQLVRQTVPGALWVPWWVRLSAFFLVCCSDFKSIVCLSDIISAFRVCLLCGTCQRQDSMWKCSLVEKLQSAWNVLERVYVGRKKKKRKSMMSSNTMVVLRGWKNDVWSEICVLGVTDYFLHGGHFLQCWGGGPEGQGHVPFL